MPTNKPTCELFLMIAETVRQRDDYTCQLCGKKSLSNYTLPVHHIHGDSERCFTDFITVCCRCHRRCTTKSISEEKCMSVLRARGLLEWKYELEHAMMNFQYPLANRRPWNTEKESKCVRCVYRIHG